MRCRVRGTMRNGAAAAVLAISGCLATGPDETLRPPVWAALDDAEAAGATGESRAVALAEKLDARRRGRELYRYACAPCHGIRGDGRGPGAAPLDPKPTDFLHDGFIMGDSDHDVFVSISDGISGTDMPAWKELLSQDDRWDLVAYVQWLAERGAGE